MHTDVDSRLETGDRLGAGGESPPLCRELPTRTQTIDQAMMGSVTGGAILAPKSALLPAALGISMNTPLPGASNMTVGNLVWGGALGIALSLGTTLGPAVASWAWDRIVDTAEVPEPVPGYPYH